MKTRIYLRDLTPEQQREWLGEILANPELKAAYESGDDIVIGEFRDHPMTLDQDDRDAGV